jgi:hypothetical protein
MEFKCIQCKKDYSSYQSLWNHNKKFHTNDSNVDKHKININQHSNQHKININQPEENNIQQPKTLECKNCHKIFSFIQSRWRHEKKCKEKDTTNNEIIELKEEINKLKTEITKKANKKTINNNHGNIQNGHIINNITINKIGNENLSLLNDNEITTIFNKELEGITTFIELLNFNERLPENHSYCTTSLESKFLSVYNSETNKIEKDRKKYFFDKLLGTTVDRIQILYNSNKTKFSKIKQKLIEDNIKKLKTFKNYDFNNKILKEMINKMNLVTYNKKSIVQKTWHEDSDSEDDFQKDLDKSETKAEFYKKMEMKEKLALEAKYEDSSVTESSITEKLIIKPKSKKPALILKHTTISSDSDNDDNIFLEVYNN